jgi:hypothetical protein
MDVTVVDSTNPNKMFIKVGSIEYNAPMDLLMSCVTISGLIKDFGLELDQVIPIPTQQNQEYSAKELDHFFMLFEYSQRSDYTHEKFRTYAKFFNFTQHEMDKYLILNNFLDNLQFQKALCNFYAYMILYGTFTTP